MEKIELCKIYVDEEMKQAVMRVLDSGQYIKGEENKNFEREFAKFCTTKYAVAVSSGTAALWLALQALGIKENDEVIVPSFTFIATASVVLHCNAKPVFADIDSRTYTIDPRDVEKKITEKTKAIIPVHLYGHPVDMAPLQELAEKYNLFITEDACQAHGALYKGKKVGGLGDVGCFSFFPSKPMTVCGDGGMITTNNKELAEKIAMLKDQGRKEKYTHELLGFNFRLSEIHAAIGRLQLKHLEDWIEKRREIAKLYNELLNDVKEVTPPQEAEWARHVYYVYTVRAKNRDKLLRYLKEKNIACGLYYPIPIHKQPCMRPFSSPKLENTEKRTKEVLSLPMHPQLEDADIKYIANNVKAFFLHKKWIN